MKRFLTLCLMALLLPVGFTACSSEEEKKEIVVDSSGQVGFVFVDFYLSSEKGERTSVFAKGEDVIFNIKFTNTTGETINNGHYGLEYGSFCVYDSNLKTIGKPYDEWLVAEMLKWLNPDESELVSVSWQGLRAPLSTGIYYAKAFVFSESEQKTFITKFEVK